jgi:hypothetical protein
MGIPINPTVAPQETEQAASRDPTRIQRALDQVLLSPPFRNTQQCQNLLRYIVKHTLAGEDHLLRERVIGSEVFGRRPDYEPGEDPVVRLRASEVRKRLAQFYQAVTETPEVHIDIPAGSYRATIRWREDASPPQHHETEHPSTEHLPVERSPTEHAATTGYAQPEPHTFPVLPEAYSAAGPTPELAPAVPRTRTWRIYAYAVIALAFLVAAAAVISTPWVGTENSRFRTFWGPWTNSPKPVIIAVGSNAVYRLSDRMSDQYARDHHLQTQGEEFFVQLGPNDIVKGSDLVEAENSFVALGDVAAVSHLVANLTRQRQSFQERFPNDISFAELRNNPSVLVGGFNNPMTLELTKKLRFVLRARNEIDDTQDSTRRWLLHASADSHDTEDYAIITRLAHTEDAPILSVAGMGQYGTLAAADFICSPSDISDMTRRLPKDWANRNLQLILHVKVVDFKAAATDVVAIYTW